MEQQERSATFRCPHCGGALSVSPVGQRAGFDVRTLRPMGYGDGAAEAWVEATKVTPHGKATRESEVVVPFLQSAITAGVVTLPVAALTAVAGWPVAVPVVVGTSIFTISWFYLLHDSRSLLRVVERVTNRDIDGDGKIGNQPIVEPAPRTAIDVSVAEPSSYGGRYRYMNFPTSEAGLLQLARAVTGGRAPTERDWTGRGRPFAVRAEFNAFRDQLIHRGYAEWVGRDHRHGWTLTPRGVEFFKALAARPTPLPQDGEA